MRPHKKITAPELHDLLVEAAETDRRLPPGLRITPSTWWPDVYDAEWMRYADKRSRLRLSPATAKQISNYDWIHEIVLTVPAIVDRQLLWAIATSAAFRHRGPSWTKIAKIRHSNRRQVKNVYEKVLIEASYRWNNLLQAKREDAVTQA
jgi:hypothetical protein